MNEGKSGENEAAGLVEEDEDIEDAEIEPNDETNEEIIEDDEVKEENREAEASPSSNTRLRTVSTVSTNEIISSVRGSTTRRSARTAFRSARGMRPTPIVWDNQSSIRGNTFFLVKPLIKIKLFFIMSYPKVILPSYCAVWNKRILARV